MSVTFTATCHCGAVELTGTLREDTFVPRRCTCSFCARRQAGNVSVAVPELHITKGKEALCLYQFGTKTAEHYFCGTCGIYTHHKRRAVPDEYGVNIGCIDGQKSWEYEPMLWHDGVNHPSDPEPGK